MLAAVEVMVKLLELAVVVALEVVVLEEETELAVLTARQILAAVVVEVMPMVAMVALA